MKISTRARYALRLMIDLADHGGERMPVILRDVAERQQISKRYLEQLATSLKHANLVSTAQGRGGGYSLARPPDQIHIADVIAASIGQINVVQCVGEPESCGRSRSCPSRQMWDRVNESINDVFESVTLEDLREGRLEAEGLPPQGGTPCSRSAAAQESA
jgi:Rrf2 family protein